MKISYSKVLKDSPYNFLDKLGKLPHPYDDPSDLAWNFGFWLENKVGWDGAEELEIVE